MSAKKNYALKFIHKQMQGDFRYLERKSSLQMENTSCFVEVWSRVIYCKAKFEPLEPGIEGDPVGLAHKLLLTGK